MKILQILAFINKNTKNKLKIPLYIIRGGGVYKFIKIILPDICFSWKIFNGFKVIVYQHAPSTTAFIYADYYDMKEIDILRGMCDKNSVFIDIGANVGAYCVMLMDKVKKIIAFEAHPVTFEKLKMLFFLNDYKNYQLFNIAVSDESGKIFFTNKGYLSHENSISSINEGIEINSDTLDNLMTKLKLSKDDNYIIKIDVEGFEQKVLRGGEQFLKQSVVKCIIMFP